MNIDYGIVEDFEMKLVKTDLDLITEIAIKRDLLPDFVKEIMRYNRWTYNQYADLTGRKPHTLINHARQVIMVDEKPTTKLQSCHPYPHSNGKGPKFIVRNENSMRFLEQTLAD